MSLNRFPEKQCFELAVILAVVLACFDCRLAFYGDLCCERAVSDRMYVRRRKSGHVPSFMQPTTASLLKRQSFHEREGEGGKSQTAPKPRKLIKRRHLRGFLVMKNGRRVVRNTSRTKIRRARVKQIRKTSPMMCRTPGGSRSGTLIQCGTLDSGRM